MTVVNSNKVNQHGVLIQLFYFYFGEPNGIRAVGVLSLQFLSPKKGLEVCWALGLDPEPSLREVVAVPLN